MKSRTTAAILAIFLGGIGAHKFYLNQGGMGILYLLFCWTFIPSIIGFFEGIIFLTMDDQKFNMKYNYQHSFHPANQTQNQAVTINMGEDSGNASAGSNVADELKKLHELKEIGVISQEESESKKKQLL